MIPMHQLIEGEKARISHIDAPWEIKRRLMEIGFTPGSLVQKLYQAPFKGPLVFACRGTSIALRPMEASVIIVQRWIEDAL